MTAARAWSARPFRWVWAASGLSLLGSEIGDLAIPLLALLTLDASPGEIASLRLAQFAPFLLLTLAFGVLVDRMGRRRLMITADLGRGLVLLTVAAAVLWWTLPVGWLVVAAFALGTLTVLYQLADFSFLPQVVPREALADANAKLSATQSAMSLAGNGAGGVAVQVLTAPFAILATAGSYLLSALLLRRVRVDDPAPVAEAGQPRGAWRQTREGIEFLVRDRVLRALAGEAGTWNLFNEILLLGLTLHVVRTFEYGAAALGGLLMVAGLGGFLGAWLSGHATRRFGYGRSLVATLAVGNTIPLALGLAQDGSVAALLLYAVVLTTSGFAVGLANAQAVTVRQLITPAPLRGRVNGAYRFVSWGMVAVGASLAGVVTTVWGPFAAILVGAAGTTVATLWIVFSPIPSLRDLTE
ncbi:MFS transporter [Phytohabitans kaempferiae]|uniref:MFS transporter n=1 Tax=Phytohabitans kaempferiae TaxID=1620943 RepID=A0ABV6MB77_9ACTN